MNAKRTATPAAQRKAAAPKPKLVPATERFEIIGVTSGEATYYAGAPYKAAIFELQTADGFKFSVKSTGTIFEQAHHLTRIAQLTDCHLLVSHQGINALGLPVTPVMVSVEN